ncbi:MAG: hypothetical protein ACXABY_13715 [Candidatus Thorarchaeota archaeon]
MGAMIRCRCGRWTNFGFQCVSCKPDGFSYETENEETSDTEEVSEVSLEELEELVED